MPSARCPPRTLAPAGFPEPGWEACPERICRPLTAALERVASASRTFCLSLSTSFESWAKRRSVHSVFGFHLGSGAFLAIGRLPLCRNDTPPGSKCVVPTALSLKNGYLNPSIEASAIFVPFSALDDCAKDCENKIGAEFARKQRGDRSSAESAQGGEFQHYHLKMPPFVAGDAAPRLFPVDFVITLNGFVRSSRRQKRRSIGGVRQVDAP
jgi:hypothetical protein